MEKKWMNVIWDFSKLIRSGLSLRHIVSLLELIRACCESTQEEDAIRHECETSERPPLLTMWTHPLLSQLLVQDGHEWETRAVSNMSPSCRERCPTSQLQLRWQHMWNLLRNTCQHDHPVMWTHDLQAMCIQVVWGSDWVSILQGTESPNKSSRFLCLITHFMWLFKYIHININQAC